MYVMVLNDGETYTSLKGCALIHLDDRFEDDPDIDYVIKAVYRKDLASLSQYGENVAPSQIGHIVTRF